MGGAWISAQTWRCVASSIVGYSEGFGSPELKANLFAFGVILLIMTATLTIGAKVASRSAERRLGGGQ